MSLLHSEAIFRSQLEPVSGLLKIIAVVEKKVELERKYTSVE